MKFYNRILSVLVLLALLPFSALTARADDPDGRVYDSNDSSSNDSSYDQQAPPADNQPDPPARAARLQFMTGSVSVQPHGTDEWVAGALNRPLTNSDNIWADKNSRTEINVGTGLIRIDSESSLTLTNISDNTVQLQLHQGAMNLHVRRLYDGEVYEVDTPNQAFTVKKPGDYRFDVDPDADKTVITVWQGEGESTGQGPTVRLRANQQARFSDGTSMTNDIHGAPSPDAFDEWARSRDERQDHSASARYVSPDVVGYEDLDEYGTWRNNSEYGNVWVPNRVDVGWAPYRNGHWIWVAPWGWTWMEDEPWGYAPFHYGRWVYGGGYWGWAPGPIYARPYYAPALVAWFGGGGWGVGVGFGAGYGYGWCPLGFGEPYIPWYGVSRGYFNRVNITNTRITNINVTNVYNNTYNNHNGRSGNGGHGGGPYGPEHGVRYANMRAPNGFTAVSRDALVNSQSVSRNALRVSPNQLSRVTPVRSVDVKPSRTAMLGSNAGRSAVAPPPRSFARPVVSRIAPPAGSRGNAGFRSGAAVNNADRPSAQIGNARGGERPTENVNRAATPNNVSRMPERGSMASRAAVPRPPSAGGMDNRVGTRTSPENGARSNVARPSGGFDNPRQASQPQMRQSAPDTRSQSAARPVQGNMQNGERPQMSAPRSSGNDNRGSAPTPAARSNERPAPRSELSVPRPSDTAPRGYSSAADRGSYSNSGSPRADMTRPSYQNTRPAPSYQNNRPAPNYGAGPYSRSSPGYAGGQNNRPAPNYGGGAYNRPAPAYSGGGYSRPAPSYGGGGGRAPAYGGGGGGRPSGGSNGGSRAAAPSHSSGGGGGGGRSGGNGGRH